MVIPAALRSADAIEPGEEFEIDRLGPDEYRLTRLRRRRTTAWWSGCAPARTVAGCPGRVRVDGFAAAGMATYLVADVLSEARPSHVQIGAWSPGCRPASLRSPSIRSSSASCGSASCCSRAVAGARGSSSGSRRECGDCSASPGMPRAGCAGRNCSGSFGPMAAMPAKDSLIAATAVTRPRDSHARPARFRRRGPQDVDPAAAC